MITLGPLQRWGFTLVAGPAAAFVLVAAGVNAAGASWRDAGMLSGFGGFLVYLIVLRWVRFTGVTDEGVRYRNWLLARQLPWSQVSSFGVRRTLIGRGPSSWFVVAHRRGRPPVTLRATNQPGSNRQRPSRGELAARELAADLEQLRARAAGGSDV